MRFPLVLLIGATIAASHARAQDPDSLLSVWRDEERPIADRFDAIMDYCWILKETDVDSALSSAHAFLALAKRQGSARDMADAYNTIGVVLQNAGRNMEAIAVLKRADSIYAEVAPQRRAVALGNLAGSLEGVGDHTAAIRTLLDVIALPEAGRDTLSLINAYGNLGVTYGSRKEYRHSIDAFRRSGELSAAIGDSSQYAQTQSNLGGLYADMGLLDSAHIMLGSAMRYYEPRHADDGGYASACTNMGMVLQKLGRLEEAERWFMKGLAIEKRSGQPVQEANNLVNLGFNSILHKAPRKALERCDAARRIAEETSALYELQHAHQCLCEAYEALGMYAKALEHHRSMMAVRDSLVNEQNTQEITRVEMRHEFTRRQLADSLRHASDIEQLENDRTIAQLRADRNRNRALFIGGAGALLALGGLLWYRTDRRRRQERFEKEAATMETQALRSQMNPHFIFNALNSINAYVQQNDQDSAGRYLTKFARVMRGVLENSRHSEVPLGEDLDVLRGYLELERIRMQSKFDFSIEVDPALDPKEVMVPPLVVQPFVENAIWHGVARKEGRGRITLRVEPRGGQLLWTIEDDGAGRNMAQTLPLPHAGAPKTSLGTTITRARLDLVRKQHGGRADFKYTDMPRGTRVEVEMPLLLR